MHSKPSRRPFSLALRLTFFISLSTIHFSAESLYCDIDRISVAVKIHVPDLRGNQGAGKNLSLMANEEFQQAELFTGEHNAVSGATDFSGYEIRLNPLRLPNCSPG